MKHLLKFNDDTQYQDYLNTTDIDEPALIYVDDLNAQEILFDIFPNKYNHTLAFDNFPEWILTWTDPKPIDQIENPEDFDCIELTAANATVEDVESGDLLEIGKLSFEDNGTGIDFNWDITPVNNRAPLPTSGTITLTFNDYDWVREHCEYYLDYDYYIFRSVGEIKWVVDLGNGQYEKHGLDIQFIIPRDQR